MSVPSMSKRTRRRRVGGMGTTGYTSPPVMKKTSLAVLFLTVFIDLIGFGMVIPFLSFYAREYGASGTTVGMVVGIYSIMQFFFAPVWGRMSDRIGRRPVILISLTASCAGYFLFAFSRSLTLLFLSRIVAGAGGANIGTAQAYIADKTTPENRAKGMGIIGAAFGMGFILGPPLSGILSHLGTKHGMAGNLLPGVMAGSLSLIALLIAFFVLGESKAPDLRPRSGMPPQFDRHVWHEVATHSLLFAVIATLFITLLAGSGVWAPGPLPPGARLPLSARPLLRVFPLMGVLAPAIQG